MIRLLFIFFNISIKKDLLYAIKNNCKIIQLTSQDTGSYGLDKNTNLGYLLKNICRIEGDYKIRVGMMNPYTLMKNLNLIIDGFNNPKIFKFLHIPVQSGDNTILKKMNRKYTTKDFSFIINKFREKHSELTISTDIIVGFPSETNEQFDNSIKLIKKIQPDIVNITKFSARPLTKAKNIDGRVDTQIVKERSIILTKVCNDISKKNNNKYIGMKFNIIVTKKGKNDTIIGRTDSYKPVVIKNNNKIGETLKVEITNSTSAYLIGMLI